MSLAPIIDVILSAWYPLFALLIGAPLGLLTLKVLRTPERYPYLLKLALFPMTMFVDWEYSNPRSLLQGDSAEFNALGFVMQMTLRDIDNDVPEAKRKRLGYLLVSAIVLPGRLAWNSFFLCLVLFCLTNYYLWEFVLRRLIESLANCRWLNTL